MNLHKPERKIILSRSKIKVKRILKELNYYNIFPNNNYYNIQFHNYKLKQIFNRLIKTNKEIDFINLLLRDGEFANYVDELLNFLFYCDYSELTDILLQEEDDRININFLLPRFFSSYYKFPIHLINTKNIPIGSSNLYRKCMICVANHKHFHI